MSDPRPSECCGKCPGIVGGGYDCTCRDNPRCTPTMSEHPRRAEFMSWLDRVAEEAWEWEGAFPSYDRDPDGGHEMSAWAANIGHSMWTAEQALTGQSQESPYVYLCKCRPVGTNRIDRSDK